MFSCASLITMHRGTVVSGIIALSISLAACGSTEEKSSDYEGKWSREQLATYDIDGAYENTGTAIDAVAVVVKEIALNAQDDFKSYWEQASEALELMDRFYNDIDGQLTSMGIENPAQATPAQKGAAAVEVAHSYSPKQATALLNAMATVANANPAERASRSASFWAKLIIQYELFKEAAEKVKDELGSGFEALKKISAVAKGMAQITEMQSHVEEMKIYLQIDKRRVDEWNAGTQAFFEG